MTLFEVFDRLELSALGTAVRDSAWLFPAIESVHLIGLATLGGSILVVDLRLLGFGLKDRPVAYVLDQANPWLIGAIAIMFTTGIPLFLSEALKCYDRPAFWVKMSALVLALIFTFGVRNRLARAWRDPLPVKAGLIAACSLMLWFSVAAAGRWIGFS